MYGVEEVGAFVGGTEGVESIFHQNIAIFSKKFGLI